MEVFFTPRFKRAFKKLPEALQDEVNEKIQLFKNRRNHTRLRIHRLKGTLKGKYSFSVNYRYRIVFLYLHKDRKSIALLTVGDHNVYDV